MPQTFEPAAFVLTLPAPVVDRPRFDAPVSGKTDFAKELANAGERRESDAENDPIDPPKKPEASRDNGNEKIAVKPPAKCDGGGEEVKAEGEAANEVDVAVPHVEEKLIDEPFGNPIPPAAIVIIPEPKQILVPPQPGEPGYSPPGAISPKFFMPPENPPQAIMPLPIDSGPPKMRLPIAMIDPMMGRPVEKHLPIPMIDPMMGDPVIPPAASTALKAENANEPLPQIPTPAAIAATPKSLDATVTEAPQAPVQLPVSEAKAPLQPVKQDNKKQMNQQAAHMAALQAPAPKPDFEPPPPVAPAPSASAAISGTPSASALSADAQSHSQDDTSRDDGDSPAFSSLSLSSGVDHNRAPAASTVTPFSRLLAADPSPAEQMIAHVKAAASKGESRIQIQLNPDDLGKLDIRLHIAADGHTKLSVTADNNRTLEILRSDVLVLEKMLTDVGLKADSGSLSFNLREGGQQQPGQGQGQQQGSQQQQYRSPPLDPLEEALAQTVARAYSITTPDGLDICA